MATTSLAFSSERVFWNGEVTGLKKTDRQDVWKLNTKKADITLDCASYIHHLGIKQGEYQGVIALSESECISFSKQISSWTRWGQKTEIVIDSFEEPVLYRK